MALRKDIHKVLVIGSGPIVIGQAAEFDYAGTQACRTLKKEGLEVVLINSNPATIMTDKNMADKIYIEPLTVDVVKKIIDIEKPDSILSGLGGQTALTLCMQLATPDNTGVSFLDSRGVKLLGASPETIHKAEDRQAFKDTMLSIDMPCIPSSVETTLDGCLLFAEEISYPVIVRPAFTLGGTGGGICHNEKELRETASTGLRMSPITQVLIEKCISGWKEIEFEVIRDNIGNCITVCSMENFDPVGVHTGDSIVIAPAVTLGDKEYQMLRTAAIRIIQTLGVEGGCNCQFALHPGSFEFAVIEVNPRVSRSSALASKATGYPIAKVSTAIAIGYNLDEIINQVTGTTYACFEPALDYVVVKFPKWPFDKFVYAKKTLGTQMKATGEVMSIGTSFEMAMMKAVRSIELGTYTMSLAKFEDMSAEELREKLRDIDTERSFCVFEALKKGIPPLDIAEITAIDKWFIYKLQNLVELENELAKWKTTPLPHEDAQALYERAKRYGYLNSSIEKLSGRSMLREKINKRFGVFKMVDTCAAEFAATTPYFYSTYDEENEAAQFLCGKTAANLEEKKRVIVFGSGPIRIGQGIEFDYCSVHCVWALKKMGCEAIICNNNPETVSTDFDTGDRLYFDPLTPEDVDTLLATEQPYGVVVQFGGQTAIKLTEHLKKRGVRILGTPAESIDAAEDREKFDALLERCEIPRPKGQTVFTAEEAVLAGAALGYPVLLRPSYVLGGQNMIIARGEEDVREYMEIITNENRGENKKLKNPVLLDKYMMGIEVEVDAICDGEDFLIPGIMQHVERAGVHSGDSISVYPPYSLGERIKRVIVAYTQRVSRELKILGLVNIQYVVYESQVFIIEVNPRSSRTVPYISKVTGINMVELATKIMLGKTLKQLGYDSGSYPIPGLYPESKYVAVKVPVFSFEKLHDVDTQLGPEMKSTGEVLGIARSFDDAMYKGLLASRDIRVGFDAVNPSLPKGVLISVRNSDKSEVLDIADRFDRLGYKIYATSHTASMLNRNLIPANIAYRISEEKEPNILSLLESDRVQYVISTSETGRKPALDSVRIRRKAVERGLSVLTSIDTARALLRVLESGRTIDEIEMIDICTI